MITLLETVLDQAQQRFSAALGEKLLSFMVYGSAAVGDYQPGRSDINTLLVLEDLELAVLDRVRQAWQGLRRQRLAAPLLMTPEHIQTSADVFPIEFLEIQEKHRVLWGEDFFKTLRIDSRNLRHELEHEVKGRLIRLRQSYLELGPRSARLPDLLKAAHNANFAAFRSALRTRNITPPGKKDAVGTLLAEQFGFDAELLQTLRQLQTGHLKRPAAGWHQLMDRYLREVEKLASVIDAA